MAKTAEKATTEKKESKVVKAQESMVVRTKVAWTLERAMKYARRYPSEVLWASGSPASYKSAVAKGWRDQCVAEITANSGKVMAGNFKKKSDSHVSKKAA